MIMCVCVSEPKETRDCFYKLTAASSQKSFHNTTKNLNSKNMNDINNF